MTEAIFGNPWHGTLRPDWLTLPDSTILDTCPLEGYAAGTYFPPVGGHSYYYKKSGLPEPTTPDQVSGFGGEFKDDFVLFSSTKRYSPFCETSLLGTNQWLHLGSDGQWRKFELVVTSGPSQYTTVEVRRLGLFGQINTDTPTENVLIDTLTLESPVLVGGYNSFVLGDNKKDGSSVVCFVRGNLPTLRDRASIVSGVDIWAAADGIVGAWTISVSSDGTSAESTQIYSMTTPTEDIVVPVTQNRATGTKYWEIIVRDPENEYADLASWRTPGQQRGDWYEAVYQCERMIGAAWTADGSLELLMYQYKGTYTSEHDLLTGTFMLPPSQLWLDQGGGNYTYLGPGDPDDLQTEWAEGSGNWYLGGPPYVDRADETVIDETGIYDIKIKSNDTILKTLTALPTPVCYAVAVTNNVFDFRKSGESISRVAPAAIDDTAISGTVYAAFDHRTGNVVSSSGAIGFV